MLLLSAKSRKDIRKHLDELRGKGFLPGVLYGPKIKPQAIEVALKEFEGVFKQAGESTLFSLEVDDKKFSVLIHEIKRDPVTDDLMHVDFYQPILTEEVEIMVPIVFEGEPLAVKELGGTFVMETKEIEVKALPQNLPHEIKVNVEGLKTFEDEILVKDLNVPENVTVLKNPDEIVANVMPPQKVEEELEQPIEEKPEDVEDAEEKGEEKETKEEGEEKATEKPEK